MKKLKNMSTAFLYLLVGIAAGLFTIIAAFLTYRSTVADNNQKDRIENLGKINRDISINIERLTTINNQVSNSIDSMAKLNVHLGTQNLALLTSANELTRQVQAAVATNNSVTEKLDKKTDEEFAVTGKFNVELKKAFKNGDVIKVYLGNNPISQEYDPTDRSPIFIQIGDEHYLKGGMEFLIRNGVLLVNANILDQTGNVLAEIRGNNWRVNKNTVSKFNFDERGCEIYDNSGQLAISFDVLDDNQIRIQGPRYSPPPYKQLFIYHGQNWRGKRVK